MANYTLKAETGHIELTGQPVSFVVTRVSQLPPQLSKAIEKLSIPVAAKEA